MRKTLFAVMIAALLVSCQEKRFGVRVVHYYEDRYTVEYNNNYGTWWIGTHECLPTFKEMNPWLGTCQEALLYAIRMKTIEKADSLEAIENAMLEKVRSCGDKIAIY
jgi:hypothetical protein